MPFPDSEHSLLEWAILVSLQGSSLPGWTDSNSPARNLVDTLGLPALLDPAAALGELLLLFVLLLHLPLDVLDGGRDGGLVGAHVRGQVVRVRPRRLQQLRPLQEKV